MLASNLMPHPKHYFALILNLRPQNLQSVSRFEQFVSRFEQSVIVFEQSVSKIKQSVLNAKAVPKLATWPQNVMGSFN